MREFFLKLFTKNKNEYYIKLSKYLDNNTKKFIVTANPETFMMAERDEEMRNILLDEKNDIVPDGIAVVKAAKFYGINVEERITGIDMSVEILKLLNNKKKTLYLFGAKKEVVEALKVVVASNYPRIKILGTSDGYVTDKDKVLKEIIALCPDVCLVALGIPEQEKLIARHIDEAIKGIYVGVGGTFDVLSGCKKRAPDFFIKMNLEWLYRLIKEPKRIRRFWDNNVRYIWRTFWKRK